jgi:hypothetical protein
LECTTIRQEQDKKINVFIPIQSEMPHEMCENVLIQYMQGSTTIAFNTTTNKEYKEMWNRHHWIGSFGETYQKTIEGVLMTTN